MQFSAILMQGSSIEGQATIISHEGAHPEKLGTVARVSLLESGLRVRRSRKEQVMSLATLHRFAEIFGEIVEDQQTSGESRYVTAYSRGDEIYQSEGQITLLGHSSDITCIIEAIDDETQARQKEGSLTGGNAGHFSDTQVEEMYKG